MGNEQLVNELILELNRVCRELSFDPNVPTNLQLSELFDTVRAAAPVLLIVFGSPAAAAVGLGQTFEKLFTRLDRVEEALDRIEEGVKRLEEKHDAATLAKFRAGFREFRDGTRAHRRNYREQLLLSARSKLTELAELPPGLEYSALPSQIIAAASCLLIAFIDTWSGEIEAAQRYNLRAIVADPLWCEAFLPKSLIQSVGGAPLEEHEQDTNQRLKFEANRNHNFLWQKVGTVAAGGAGALFFGLVMRQPRTAQIVGHSTAQAFHRLDTPEAQEAAREKSIQALRKDSMQKRINILRIRAKERLKDLGD